MLPSLRGWGRRSALALALVLGLAPVGFGERASQHTQDLARLLEHSGDWDESADAQEAALSADGSARLNATASEDKLADGASASPSRREVHALHGSGAKDVDQPAESVKAGAAATQTSSDNMSSELKAAKIEVHEALMHAQQALAEQQQKQQKQQQKQQKQEQEQQQNQQQNQEQQKQQKHQQQQQQQQKQQGSRADGNATSGHREGPAPAPEQPTPQKFAEDKARQLEEVTLQGSLQNLSKAFNDPRGFLIELPGMSDFSAGTKAAIDLGPHKGRCLASGEFAGYGCGDSKEFPRMCSCPGWFQRCHLPDDPQSIVDTFSKGDIKRAYEEAKTLLFGKCYRSILLMSMVGVIAMFALYLIFAILRKVFTKASP